MGAAGGRASDGGTPDSGDSRLTRRQGGMVDAAGVVVSQCPGVIGGSQDRRIPRFTPQSRSISPAAPGCSWRWSFPSKTGCEPPRSSAVSDRRPPSSPNQIGSIPVGGRIVR